jgi:peptidase E
MKRQIIIHGGGFSYEPKDEWTDDYIVSQVHAKHPQCLFLAHTTDDAVRYNEKFYRRWAYRETRNRTLSLFTPETSDMRALILESHIIYVGGGNTKSMLALWREWGLDQHLAEAYRQGSVLCGVSAGAICWFEEGFSDAIPGRFSVVRGLGLLRGICNPHHGSAARASAFVEHLKEHDIEWAVGVPDGPVVYTQGRQEALACIAPQPRAAGDALPRAPER